jgi:hypothetical protein
VRTACVDQLALRRLMKPTPARPRPSKARVAGSGTLVGSGGEVFSERLNETGMVPVIGERFREINLPPSLSSKGCRVRCALKRFRRAPPNKPRGPAD